MRSVFCSSIDRVFIIDDKTNLVFFLSLFLINLLLSFAAAYLDTFSSVDRSWGQKLTGSGDS